MAKIKIPDLSLDVNESKTSLELEVFRLKKQVRNLYILSYISTAIILALRFI